MAELSKEQIVEIIAKRVAKELKDGDLVNLGIGIAIRERHGWNGTYSRKRKRKR